VVDNFDQSMVRRAIPCARSSGGASAVAWQFAPYMDGVCKHLILLNNFQMRI
jgi:hypothetical protein